LSCVPPPLFAAGQAVARGLGRLRAGGLAHHPRVGAALQAAGSAAPAAAAHAAVHQLRPARGGPHHGGAMCHAQHTHTRTHTGCAASWRCTVPCTAYTHTHARTRTHTRAHTHTHNHTHMRGLCCLMEVHCPASEILPYLSHTLSTCPSRPPPSPPSTPRHWPPTCALSPL